MGIRRRWRGRFRIFHLIRRRSRRGDGIGGRFGSRRGRGFRIGGRLFRCRGRFRTGIGLRKRFWMGHSGRFGISFGFGSRRSRRWRRVFNFGFGLRLSRWIHRGIGGRVWTRCGGIRLGRLGRWGFLGRLGFDFIRLGRFGVAGKIDRRLRLCLRHRHRHRLRGGFRRGCGGSRSSRCGFDSRFRSGFGGRIRIRSREIMLGLRRRFRLDGHVGRLGSVRFRRLVRLGRFVGFWSIRRLWAFAWFPSFLALERRVVGFGVRRGRVGFSRFERLRCFRRRRGGIDQFWITDRN